MHTNQEIVEVANEYIKMYDRDLAKMKRTYQVRPLSIFPRYVLGGAENFPAMMMTELTNGRNLLSRPKLTKSRMARKIVDLFDNFIERHPVLNGGFPREDYEQRTVFTACGKKFYGYEMDEINVILFDHHLKILHKYTINELVF